MIVTYTAAEMVALTTGDGGGSDDLDSFMSRPHTVSLRYDAVCAINNVVIQPSSFFFLAQASYTLYESIYTTD